MYELRLICPEERVEQISDALEALEALSVSVEDADAQTDAEQAARCCRSSPSLSRTGCA